MKRILTAIMALVLTMACTSMMPMTKEVEPTSEPEITTVAKMLPTPEPTPEPVASRHYEEIPLDAELQAVLFEACDENGVDYAVALALIYTESRFNPYAVNSGSGCYGLCQLNPACFPSGLSPADNIRYGIQYLGRQIRVYGSVEAGLTAYAVGHDDGSRTYANAVLAEAANWREIIG